MASVTTACRSLLDFPNPLVALDSCRIQKKKIEDKQLSHTHTHTHIARKHREEWKEKKQTIQ